ncbi:MAG: FAD-binding oxidoreductase, partial [Pseudomonadota bacterium]
QADRILIAAGCGTPALLAGLGHPVPLRDAPGMLMRTNPLPPVAGPVLASPGMDFWQGTDGRILVATGTADTLTTAPEVAAERALDRLRARLPGLDIRLEHLGLWHRPIPEDGLPAVGEVAPGVHVAVMHSGMTLGPIVADCIAAEVLGHSAPYDLAPYRPGRFAHSGPSSGVS